MLFHLLATIFLFTVFHLQDKVCKQALKKTLVNSSTVSRWNPTNWNSFFPSKLERFLCSQNWRKQIFGARTFQISFRKLFYLRGRTHPTVESTTFPSETGRESIVTNMRETNFPKWTTAQRGEGKDGPEEGPPSVFKRVWNVSWRTFVIPLFSLSSSSSLLILLTISELEVVTPNTMGLGFHGHPFPFPFTPGSFFFKSSFACLGPWRASKRGLVLITEKGLKERVRGSCFAAACSAPSLTQRQPPF